MSATEQMKVVQSIYDQFFASLTETPPGKSAVGAKDNIFVVMEKPGRLIRSRDFANAWTPGNQSGNKEAAINLATLANEIPQVSSIYAPNSSKITEIYQLILNAKVTPPPPDLAAEEAYQKAYGVIWREVTTTDEDTGEQQTKRVQTQTYKDYLSNKKKYEDALELFSLKYAKAMSTTEGQGSWPMQGPVLQGPVDDAWNTWRSAEATKVEDALAAIDMSSNNAIGRAFEDAKKLFNDYRAGLEAGVGGVPINYWRARAIPSDWHDSTVASDWPEMTASSSSYVNETSSEFTSYGGGGFVGVGLWTVGGGFNSTTQEENFHSESKNISVRFKYATVTLDRPWLNYTLFKLPGWSVSGIKPKLFSNGTKQDQKDGLIPLLPQAFIVIRGVEITADWGQTDRDVISKAVSGSGRVGWGPFSVGGSYSHSSSKDTFKAELDGSTLKIPGMQIIGWICNVVPACPPQ